jgi:hypothetical protein
MGRRARRRRDRRYPRTHQGRTARHPKLLVILVVAILLVFFLIRRVAAAGWPSFLV